MDEVATPMKPVTGMLLGKFLPPTTGHQYLIEFARAWCPDLTVIVGSLEREPIPGEQRVSWMREMFPDITILHLTDENPQYPEEHPDFWNIWRNSIRRIMPVGPDLLFASEDYGFKLAEVLGARYIPVDTGRETVKVSASQVRNRPMAFWEYIPPSVRPWFVRRICITGPESTGKSMLAERLARQYQTVWVSEYARSCIDAHQGLVDAGMFPLFVKGQAASEDALSRQANRLLICDTDTFTTALYHELYVGGRPDWIVEEAMRRRYDIYLLASPDGTPYIADSQRQHPDKRNWFFEQYRNWLDERGASYRVLEGDFEERFRQACIVLDQLLQDDWQVNRA